MIELLAFAVLIFCAVGIVQSTKQFNEAQKALREFEALQDEPDCWIGAGVKITGFPTFFYPPFQAYHVREIVIHQRDSNGNCTVQFTYKESLITVFFEPATVEWIESNDIDQHGHPLIKYLKLKQIIEQ